MSDGDNATPGRPDHARDNDWLTRSERPAPGAAPWERAATPDTSTPQTNTQDTGNHTDGVTVADLIAKLADENPNSTGRTRRRAIEESDGSAGVAPGSDAEITDPVAPVEAAIFDTDTNRADPDRADALEPPTEVMYVPSAYAPGTSRPRRRPAARARRAPGTMPVGPRALPAGLPPRWPPSAPCW